MIGRIDYPPCKLSALCSSLTARKGFTPYTTTVGGPRFGVLDLDLDSEPVAEDDVDIEGADDDVVKMFEVDLSKMGASRIAS